MNEQQAKQKACHDGNSPFREFFLGQNVMSRNLRNGPDWVPGVIVERLGPLTYLVQVSSGAFWKRHVDQLRTSVDDQVKMPGESGDPLLLPETYMPPVIESTNEGSATLQPMNGHQPPCPSVSKPPRKLPLNYRHQVQFLWSYQPSKLIYTMELMPVLTPVFTIRSRGDIQPEYGSLLRDFRNNTYIVGGGGVLGICAHAQCTMGSMH